MLSFKEYINEIKSRFSDEANQDLVFELDGKKLEFKPENEVNSDGTPYFTYEEALALQKDGWRLPTKEEFQALCKYPFEFNNKRSILFDNRLYLPVAGNRYHNTVYNIDSYGYYWSSTPEGSDYVWYLNFNSGGVYMDYTYRWYGQSVRLVREV